MLQKRVEEVATAAWHTGIFAGHRQFARVLDDFVTEFGVAIGPIDVAYETWGTLNADHSNAVLVLHALTGDSHAVGQIEDGHATPGWWNGLIGPGLAIDTSRYFVVCPNVLGGCQGTTGPSSVAPDGEVYGSRFPTITIRDQVAVEYALARALGIERFAGIVGGSMGGMRVLEWLISYPEACERAVVLAVGATATAEQIALSSLQIRMIESDPNFCGGDYHRYGVVPSHGLRLARELAHLSYRSPDELDTRFGRSRQSVSSTTSGADLDGDASFAVESYLAHHGQKLVQRFDANSYIRLSEAMNHHDVGRGRGGVRHALRRVKAKVTVIGISSDRLFPVQQQRTIAEALPTCDGMYIVESRIGHDGFLVEVRAIGDIIRSVL
ncbi:homoserine O-acetyltransferase [Ferrimicrobium sp.]|uniref:homoserine O-acetyltransferase MetX n=1 Tax=Ferrimicrobium sp. TaxID=2926050 RepID=UPI002612B0EC|nr:homoserine O-acetyltransferase [Ferrimicrobium sp.]